MDGTLSWLTTPITAVRNFVNDYKKWSAFVQELEEAGEDGQRILQELRLCHGDINKLRTSRPGDAALLYRMMEALGIAADEIEAGILRDMQRVCAGCGHKAECRDDLATGKAAERWRDYCANRVNLDAIQKTQHHVL